MEVSESETLVSFDSAARARFPAAAFYNFFVALTRFIVPTFPAIEDHVNKTVAEVHGA